MVGYQISEQVSPPKNAGFERYKNYCLLSHILVGFPKNLFTLQCKLCPTDKLMFEEKKTGVMSPEGKKY